MFDLRDRIAGSLYGLLVGDALGCPVEGWNTQEIRATFGLLQTMEEARKRWRPAGLHSDDGQQALALCDALLQDPRAPSTAFARLLVELYQAGPQRRHCFGLHRGHRPQLAAGGSGPGPGKSAPCRRPALRRQWRGHADRSPGAVLAG